MPRQAVTWLTTDTHFFHDRMMDVCGRPGDFNTRIVKEWKFLAAPQDLTIHLGDVIFYNLPNLKAMLDQVPGKKILVRGNHDKESLGWYMRNGFDYACDGLLIDDVWLSHKPAPVLPTGARFNIHGHWHNFPFDGSCPERTVPPWYDPAKYKLLALEHEHYKPVNLQAFLAPLRKVNESTDQRTVDRGPPGREIPAGEGVPPDGERG